MFVVISSFLLAFYSNGWAQAWVQDKASNDELNLIDLFVARPLSIVAAGGGTCLFVLSLPFTLPTRSVADSFNLFVVAPWNFSFVRDFPDEKTF